MAKWYDNFVTIDKDGYPIFHSLPTRDQIANIVPTSEEGMIILHKLQAFIGMENADEIRRASQAYLARFKITSNNPLYKQKLNELIETATSNRVMVATARRVTEQFQTITAMDGKLDSNCVYVNEGDAPCDACLYLNGETGTYKFFIENNMRPGDQCYGGDNCLCILIPYE